MKTFKFLLLTLVCCCMTLVTSAQTNLVQNGGLENAPNPVSSNGFIDLVPSATGWGKCTNQTHPQGPNINTPVLWPGGNLPAHLNALGNYSGFIYQTLIGNSQGWFGTNENANVPVSIPGAGTYFFSMEVGSAAATPAEILTGYEILLIGACGGSEKLIASGTVNPMAENPWATISSPVTLTAAEAAMYSKILIRVDNQFVSGQFRRSLYFDNVSFRNCPPAFNFQMNQTACISDPIVVDMSLIQYDPGTLTLSIQETTPGSSMQSAFYSYIGAGQATQIDLNSASTYGSLLDSYTPFPFSCNNNCGYYNVSVTYQICGVQYQYTRPLHVFCCYAPCSQLNASFGSLNTPNTCTHVFQSNSTSIPSDPIVSWAWNFGDGTTASGPSVTHSFSNRGIYTVCLTVTTVAGCKETYCKTYKCKYAGSSSSFAYSRSRTAPNSALEFSIFPNPVKHRLNLTHNLEVASELTIFNTMGQLVHSQTVEANSSPTKINLPDLSPGLYLIKVGQGNQVLYQEKFLVQ